MTPTEFYDGPAKRLMELVEAKRRLAAEMHESERLRRADAAWERVCQFCRRPSTRRAEVYEDLADVVANLLELAAVRGVEGDLVAMADSVMRPKMVDYAGDECFSANFERNARRAGLPVAKVWCVFASKHWDAVTSWAISGRTESEPIEGRIADVINYCQLLAGMVYAEVI